MSYRVTEEATIRGVEDPEKPFTFLGNEFNLSDFHPPTQHSEELAAELNDLGYGDGIMPRGGGNADNAAYVINLSEFYGADDEISIALIEYVGGMVGLIPVDLLDNFPEGVDPDMIPDTGYANKWADDIDDIVEDTDRELSDYRKGLGILVELAQDTNATDQHVMEAYTQAGIKGLPTLEGLFTFVRAANLEAATWDEVETTKDDDDVAEQVSEFAAHISTLDDAVRDVVRKIEPLSKAVMDYAQ